MHIFVLFCFLFVFKIERQTNIYNAAINVNLKSIKNFKTENISKEKNYIDISKEKESKKEINNNTKTITEIKTPKKEANKKKIKTNNSINKLKVNSEEEKNNNNNDQLEKKRKDSKPDIISQQQNLEKEKINNTSSEIITDKEKKVFNDYNDELRALIQKNATQNYPRISLRKKEEGIVELNFSIDIDGNVLDIKTGKKTSAPQRLINASIKTLELISPYKKNPVLKKNNTFSIIIVYKLR